MKKFAVLAFVPLLFWACKKEEHVSGSWNVETHSQNFPFKSSLSFGADSLFEGRTDTLTRMGKWYYKSHSNGDYITVRLALKDSIIFKVEKISAKKMDVSVYGFSFLHDHASLRK